MYEKPPDENDKKKRNYCRGCDAFRELPDGVYCEECLDAFQRGGIASD